MNNPYALDRPPLDLRAIATWNAENARAHREYVHGDTLLDAACPTCTTAATCWRCRSKARRYLKVATSQAECAELLTIIDRPSPAAAQCGTPGGYRSHYRRGEQACRPCLDAHNEACRGYREGAV